MRPVTSVQPDTETTSMAIDIDLDTFKARRGYKQLSFWVALAPILLALLPTDARDYIAVHWQAVAASSGPLVAWLLAQGYVRGQGAAGAAEVAKTQAIMQPLTPSGDEVVDLDDLPGYDERVDATQEG